MIARVVAWLTDPAHAADIGRRVAEHLGYSFLALALACAIGIPLGLAVGHTGKGRGAVVTLVNGARSLPTLGLLFVLVLLLGPHLPGDASVAVPALVVLVLLAVPPVLAATYSGIEGVDPSARDAAKGMGMTGWQVLWRVEVPCALPLVWSGVRSALLQIVATATIAAYVSLGGLGRFLVDGLAQSDYPQVAGGAFIVSALALALDLLLALVQRFTVSRGLTRRYRVPAADTDLTPAATTETLDAGLTPTR